MRATKDCALSLSQKIVHCHGQFNSNCDNIVLAFEACKDFKTSPSTTIASYALKKKKKK